jgi:hypothetical protein
MRLFSVLPVLSLLLGTRASSHGSREPAPHRLDVRSPILDVCVAINADIAVPNILEIVTAVGVISESIFSSLTCPKVVPAFLKRVNRRMHLSVGPSPVPRDGRGRQAGR